MTIEQIDKLDFCTFDPKSGDVTLIIVDHLPWDEGTHEEGEHLLLLQEKINKYLAGIESGELYEKFPEAKKGQKLIIQIAAVYSLGKQATFFFNKAKDFLSEAGYELRFRLLPKEELKKEGWRELRK